MTNTIRNILEQVNKSAELNIQDNRIIETMKIGDVVRQGDIYIHAVKANHEHGVAANSNQLAQGTSKGSRHVAEQPAKAFEGTSLPSYAKEAFIGPYVESESRFVISHPEHADISLPKGNYQITHQMDARTLERVRD